MKIVIVGAGFTGVQLAKLLINERNQVAIIDNDEDATVSIISEDENDKKFLNKKRKKENNTRKKIT